MVAVHVSHHAIQRYQERVANVTDAEAREAIATAVTRARAIEVGAPYVKLGTGQHIAIENGSVVTVLDRWTDPRRMSARAQRNREAWRYA